MNRHLSMVINIVILAMILFIIVVKLANAQVDTARIRNFSPGLVTRAGDFNAPSGAADVAVNLDFGRKVGSFHQRYGYEPVDTMHGVDSIVSIDVMEDFDGESRLVLVVDDTGNGYGSVWVTQPNSVNLDSADRVIDVWGIQSPTQMEQKLDRLFGVNGRHKGFVYDGNIARDFPVRAPGEPKIIPINGTGDLHGSYRYLFYIKEDTTDWELDGAFDLIFTEDSVFQGVVTQPVKVDSGQVRLSDFLWPAVDSVRDWSDGIDLVIGRTMANPGRLTLSDTFYIVERDVYIPDRDSLENFVYIDSVPDDDLLWFDSIPDGPFGLWLSDRREGYDTTGSTGFLRYGAPGLDSTIHATASWKTDSTWGLVFGADTGVVAWAYAVSFIDTITGLESDTGRSIFIYHNADSNAPVGHALFLPEPPEGLVTNLYRAQVKNITYADSTQYDTTYYRTADGEPSGPYTDSRTVTLWRQKFSVDTTIITDYFLVDQIIDDTVYLDTVRQDSLKFKDRYEKTTAPSLLTNLRSYKNYLFGSQGSAVFYSRVDDPYNWGLMNVVNLDIADGDVITLGFPARTAMRWMKHNSAYNIYEAESGAWTKTEITQRFGCVAPESYIAAVTGHYYMSSFGVIRETEGQQLERTFSPGVASSQLDNFQNMTVDDLRDTRGFYHDQKCMFSIPRVDSTYVFFERSGGWSVWDFTFVDAVHYDTRSDVDVTPADSMYFIMPGDSVLYRYGGTSDAGDSINVRWRSLPIGADMNEYTPTELTLWSKSSVIDSGSIGMLIYDETGNFDISEIIPIPALSAKRAYRMGARVMDPMLYFQVEIRTAGDGLGSTEVDGLDIIFQKGAEIQTQ